MTEISGRRGTPRIQAGWSVAGSSTATTSGRSRRMAARTSRANSRRPGTTGKYVNRPRERLPGSGIGRPISPGIAESFLSQHLDDGDLQAFGVVGAVRGQALQLDGVAGDIDAVAHRVAL